MNEPPHRKTAPPTQPFLLPRKLPVRLARLQHYWNDLRRGENAVLFSDDVNVSAVPELSAILMLVEVFERPQRFRFSRVGQELLGDAQFRNYRKVCRRDRDVPPFRVFPGAGERHSGSDPPDILPPQREWRERQTTGPATRGCCCQPGETAELIC